MLFIMFDQMYGVFLSEFYSRGKMRLKEMHSLAQSQTGKWQSQDTHSGLPPPERLGSFLSHSPFSPTFKEKPK